jgi:hypothetical protein
VFVAKVFLFAAVAALILTVVTGGVHVRRR